MCPTVWAGHWLCAANSCDGDAKCESKLLESQSCKGLDPFIPARNNNLAKVTSHIKFYLSTQRSEWWRVRGKIALPPWGNNVSVCKWKDLQRCWRKTKGVMLPAASSVLCPVMMVLQKLARGPEWAPAGISQRWAGYGCAGRCPQGEAGAGGSRSSR